MNSSKATLALSRRCLFPRLCSLRTVTTQRTALNFDEPPHAVRMDYNARAKAARAEHGSDSTFGVKPSNAEKYFLVLTRLFQNKAEIPEFVPSPTMHKMHDRMRIVFIGTALTLFFTIFWTAEWRIHQKMAIDQAYGRAVKTIHDI